MYLFIVDMQGTGFHWSSLKTLLVFQKDYLVRILLSLLSKFAITLKTTLWNGITSDVTELNLTSLAC